MAVTLYANWGNGYPLSGSTYTAVAPDVPVSHTWTFNNGATIAQDNNSPWNGQYLAYTSGAYSRHVSTTVSSATVQASQNRGLIEVDSDPNGNFFYMAASTVSNGRFRIDKNGTDLRIRAEWNGYGSDAEVVFATFPTPPFAVEWILDTQNATANQRIRARHFAVGGSAGSFTNATSTGGGAAATDQFTVIEVGGKFNESPFTEMDFGRVIISDDITEDLSTWSPGGGGGTAVPVFVHHMKTQGIQ